MGDTMQKLINSLAMSAQALPPALALLAAPGGPAFSERLRQRISRLAGRGWSLSNQYPTFVNTIALRFWPGQEPPEQKVPFPWRRGTMDKLMWLMSLEGNLGSRVAKASSVPRQGFSSFRGSADGDVSGRRARKGR